MITKHELIKGTKKELYKYFCDIAFFTTKSKVGLNNLASRQYIKRQLDVLEQGNMGIVFYLIETKRNKNELNLELKSSRIEFSSPNNCCKI